MANVHNLFPARVAQCPVCGRKETIEAEKRTAKERLKEMGWRETSKIPRPGRMLVCPRHVEPNSYKIWLDKEHNRVEWKPAEHSPSDV
jgi:uncharacterized Zn finger protein (UPF0148 family)